jgi:hypothetical protein
MSATVTPDMKGIVERAVVYPEPWRVPNGDTWSTAVPATFVLTRPYGDSDNAWPTYGPGTTARPPSCAVRKAARAERKRLKKDKQRHKKGRK